MTKRAIWLPAVLIAGAAAQNCPPAAPATTGANWNGWSDGANTRFQPARWAGLTVQNTPKLKLKWAFGFPGVTSAQGTPAVQAGRVYVGAPDGSVYALDSGSGCTYWTFKAAAGVRATPVIDGTTVFVGDLKANVYALDASSGKLVWKTLADEQPNAVITGSPKLDRGRLYVPISGRDESMAAANASYECCTFRGSVVALDAATGKRAWIAYTVEPAKPTGQNSKGTKTFGPSGAVPWSSPTLDSGKRILYIGTGVNYSQPATNTSDAVLAFDMDNGHLLWSSQLTKADAYNFACTGQDKTNCPTNPFVDVDFGNSGILRTLSNNKRVLVIADKGGTIYGVDPDQEGKLLWKQKVAGGGVNGGFMWGGAADEQGVAYFGISDFNAAKPETGGGLIAIQMSTGEKLWLTPAPKPACLGKKGCAAAQPAPATVIPGVVFLGSWDGHLRAYETKRGAIVWDVDTALDFKTTNGVAAHGGSINSMGPVVAGGMLYVTSGYTGNGMPGNVLLAYSVDGK
jgi:polyvinyl alcohol dehydrogenase (cytochrome)